MSAWRVPSSATREVLSLDEVDRADAGCGPGPGAGARGGPELPGRALPRGRYQERPPLPFTPGLELCGVVEGPRASGCSARRRAARGGFAEQALMDADRGLPGARRHVGRAGRRAAHHLPDRPRRAAPPRAAAAGEGCSCTPARAASAARRSSSAGRRGQVIATAGGPEKAQVCRDLGADVVVDYRAEDFVAVVKEVTGGRGADVVYDPVGGDMFDKSPQVHRLRGPHRRRRVHRRPLPEAPANHVLVKNYGVVGAALGAVPPPRAAALRRDPRGPDPAVGEGPDRAAGRGRAAAGSARRRMPARRAGGTVGKVVLMP